MRAAIDTAPANAASTADTRDARAAWALSTPALMLFIGVLLVFIYIIFAMTLYMVPPGAHGPV